MKRKKKWICAQYWATSKNLEVAQSAMIECGALGIESDDGIGPENTRAYGDDRILLKAYFEPTKTICEKISHTIERFFSSCDFKSEAISFSEILEEDWQGNFVRSCTTFKVEPAIFIVPSFEIEAFKKNPLGDLFIEMDPENAFGTGQHQTTKLCLSAIYNFILKIPIEKRASLEALDVGCGSGILAILLKKLKVGHVAATDIDNDALETAKKNVRHNEVDVDLFVVDEDYKYTKNTYDLLVANILAPTLIQMASNLLSATKNGGVLKLSGILDYQSSSVIEAYEKEGARLLSTATLDDWCVLVLIKN